MENDKICSECELEIREYKQTDKIEGRDDLCECCCIVLKTEEE